MFENSRSEVLLLCYCQRKERQIAEEMALLEQKKRSYTNQTQQFRLLSWVDWVEYCSIMLSSRVNIWVAFELRFHRIQVLLWFTTQVSKVTSKLRFHLPEQFGCIQGLDSNRCGHGIPSFISFVITARPLSCTPRPQVTEHDFHEDQRETLQWTLGAV